jgi:hypothetical protein
VILAVVDDLMFTSKIKTTAGQLGVPVVFAQIEQRRAGPDAEGSRPHSSSSI